MASKFEKGDVVLLKSGGPAMTVSRINDGSDDPTYECTWFDNDTLRREEFDEDLLKKYEPQLGMAVV